MRFSHAVSLIALLTFSAPVLADEYVIMKLNGQDISSSEVQQTWEGFFPAGQAPPFDSVKPDMRERILRAVMAEKIIYGEALKQGADKSPKMLADLENVKRKLIVRSYLDSKSADSITDADVKREYDSMIVSAKDDGKEVRARHILLATEQEAKDVKKKLDGGKNFEEAARELSKDPGTAPKGGDLGYFTKDKMVKEFADAAFSMKKGEVSGPVKSNFGYHLIKVEDSRKVTPPTFNEVKDQIRGKLQEKKLNDYIDGLVKSANVKTFDAKGKEVPFSKELPKPVVVEATKPTEVEAKAAADAKPASDAKKPAEAKPAEKTDPKHPAKVEAKPAPTAKPAEVKPAVAAKPADAKPAEVKPAADTKPADTKPAKAN